MGVWGGLFETHVQNFKGVMGGIFKTPNLLFKILIDKGHISKNIWA